MKYILIIILFLLLQVNVFSQFDNFKEYRYSGRGVIFSSRQGCSIKITPYGKDIIRVQAVRKGEDFFPNNYYEMVESHDWNGKLIITEDPDSFTINSSGDFTLVMQKNPMRIKVIHHNDVLFSESKGIEWIEDKIIESFIPDLSEHFTGLGHGFFGRSSGIDLKGQVIGRNYGTKHGDQSLTVLLQINFPLIIKECIVLILKLMVPPQEWIILLLSVRSSVKY